MNATELADEFQNRKDWKLINYIHWSEQSETMLRQQQAEIETLKALLVKEQDESFDRTASHMAGEYVSYKAELTDEEILYFYKPCFYHAEDFVSEIRAILRKAQE